MLSIMTALVVGALAGLVAAWSMEQFQAATATLFGQGGGGGGARGDARRGQGIELCGRDQ